MGRPGEGVDGEPDGRIEVPFPIASVTPATKSSIRRRRSLAITSVILVAELAGQVEEHLDAGRVDVRDRLRVEDEPRGLGRRAADRLVHPALHVSRVREEEPVVEPVDDDPRSDLRVRVQRDVPVPLELGHPAEHRVVRPGAAPHRVDDGEPDRDDQRLEHAEEDHAGRRDAGDRDLDAVDRRERRQAAASTMPIPAATITAPSTACGRYWTGSVRKRRTTTTVAAENRPAICVRAPIESFTAGARHSRRPRSSA